MLLVKDAPVHCATLFLTSTVPEAAPSFEREIFLELMAKMTQQAPSHEFA